MRWTIAAPILFYLGLFAAGSLLGLFYSPSLGEPIDLEAKNPLVDKAVGVVVEASKLVVSVGTLVFAGCGALTFGDKGNIRKLHQFDSYVLIGAMCGASLAIYFAFSVYIQAGALIDEGTFRSGAGTIQGPLRMAYYSLLGGVLALGLVFVTRLARRIE